MREGKDKRGCRNREVGGGKGVREAIRERMEIEKEGDREEVRSTNQNARDEWN